MISKPTNAHQYILYTPYISYMRRPLNMTFLRKVHYKGQIRRNIAEVFEPMHRYKILNFKNNTWFIIHIKHQNTDKNICN